MLVVLCRSLLPVLLVAPLLCCQRDPGDAPYRLVDAFPGQEKFHKPLLLEHSPADPGHYYVVEQHGRIWRVPSDPESSRRELFFDGRERILSPGSGGHTEEGLLGFAFDPKYASNRHVWIYYSERVGRRSRQSIVARYSVKRATGSEPDAAPVVDGNSELRVLRVHQPWGNHNGGTIVFGPDDMLYIALGDGGSAGDPKKNGQDLGTLLGSVLRIDVRDSTVEEKYRIPKDNPFVGKEGARGEIWAYGLRNPWRITFDRATGELWCGDVGQNRQEEVDRVVKGGNHGWRALEGHLEYDPGTLATLDRDALVPPVAVYARSEGISVTGGYVYRGKRHSELLGEFVYGDFATGTVWSVREDREGGEHRVRTLAHGAHGLASFAELPSGELLLLRFDGRIYRLAPSLQKPKREGG